MQKTKVMKQILDEGIVAVIRADSAKEGEMIADAVIDGGIHIIEMTMTVPGAVDHIKELNRKYKDNKNIIIGAGTVLDSETARLCILSGAQFIVAPSFNIETVKLCNRYGIPVIPGIMTVKEAVEAMEMGADILKVFPGDVYGPSIIKAFKGPIPQANFLPTGGVSIDNIDEWFRNGAVAVGVGGNLTFAAKTGDFQLIREKAGQYKEAVKRAKEKYCK